MYTFARVSSILKITTTRNVLYALIRKYRDKIEFRAVKIFVYTIYYDIITRACAAVPEEVAKFGLSIPSGKMLLKNHTVFIIIRRLRHI